MQIYIISISKKRVVKRYKNGKKWYSKHKKYWTVYYMTEDKRFRSVRIKSKIDLLYLWLHKHQVIEI